MPTLINFPIRKERTMRKQIRYVFIFWISVLLLASQSVSFSNAAEPPSILIIVPGAPEALSVEIHLDGGVYAPIRVERPLQTQFSFFNREIRDRQSMQVHVNTGTETFECPLEKEALYRNIYTLDLNAKTLIPGKNTFRTTTIIATRVLMTLLIEAGALWLFGFRQRRTWVVFVLVNLVTQGLLNVNLSELGLFGGYHTLALFISEIGILFVEGIVFGALVSEHKLFRRLAYVCVANAASFFIGGYLIMQLPA